jgi:hypothetical protein
MKLSSDLWVYALLRRAQIAGAAATIVRKGDARGGAVLIKTFDPKTREARLYAQAFGRDGESVWMQPLSTTAEDDLDAYAARAAQRDPDLWVVEIEDSDARRFLTEPLEDD